MGSFSLFVSETNPCQTQIGDATIVLSRFQAAYSLFELGSIAGINADIVIREICCPHVGMSVTLPKVDGNRKLLVFEDLRDFLFRLQPHSYPSLHHDNIIESHRDLVWVDRNTRSTQGSHDSTPIGILPK